MNKAELEKLYPAGTRVELVKMDDPHTRLKPGDKGTVEFIDDALSVHIRWDSGEGLAAIFGMDIIKVVKKYLLIGSYTPEIDEAEAIIERGGTEQGWVFKDENAFVNRTDKVCYIPELHDTGYTRQNFLDMCGGREDFAAELFDFVDWQSPETLLQEWLANGEWDECEKCDWLYSLHPTPAACEKCGAEFKTEGGGNE